MQIGSAKVLLWLLGGGLLAGCNSATPEPAAAPSHADAPDNRQIEREQRALERKVGRDGAG